MLETANNEVAALGLLPRDVPEAGASRPEGRVVPYVTGLFSGLPRSNWIIGLILLVSALLLVPPCANLAILVYARTVTRRQEFAARSALGASRGRIVMQIFVEVLVLAAAAGLVGLLIARQFSGRLARIVIPQIDLDNLSFWIDFEPSLPTVAGVAGLSVLAAAIAGAVPAWHATGRWRRAGLLASGGRDGGARLGMTWTTLLAMQVALSIAILPSATEMTWGIFRPAIVGPGLPVEEYLTASLAIEGDTSRFDTLKATVIQQLASEAGISGVTASAVPLTGEPERDIEVEGAGASGVEQGVNSVDAAFFDVFDVRFLAGRDFDARDFGDARSTFAIVNRMFVAEVFGDGNALGRRVRLAAGQEAGQAVAASPWYEIVGVVENLPANDLAGPIIYLPMTAPADQVALTVRAPSGAGFAAGVLRSVAARVDSRLRVGRVRTLEEVFSQSGSPAYTFGVALVTIVTIVLLFSIAGLYTLVAFIVAQRWREIGVRSALGAGPRRLLAGAVGRAAVPLIIGAIAGCALAIAVNSSLPIVEVGGRRIPGIIPLSAAFMILVGVLAVAGPARRAIRVNPTEALRVG
jgi:predicted permease